MARGRNKVQARVHATVRDHGRAVNRELLRQKVFHLPLNVLHSSQPAAPVVQLLAKTGRVGHRELKAHAAFLQDYYAVV
jgi:hypothetical protein